MPSEILEPGLEFIQFLARFRGPWVNAFFLLFTGIGSTVGYVVLFVILWWGVSWKLGAKLFVVLVLSVYLNAVIKDWVAEPRPFDYAGVKSVTRPDEYAFPSGHAQHAALIWSLLAAHFRNRRFTLVAVAVVFLVGFSRVALGVHFPTDVLGGWLLGGVLAKGYLRWSDAAIAWARRLSFEKQVALALGVPLVLTVLHGTFSTAMALGALAGALSGLALGRRQHLYPDEEAAPERRERLVLGLIGLPVLCLALIAFSPPETSWVYYLDLWMRFATIGLWVSYLVPKLVAYTRARHEDSDAPAAR